MVGIVIAFVIGFVVFQIASIYLMAWWTGKSPGFFWP
jgi:hypothetical protein